MCQTMYNNKSVPQDVEMKSVQKQLLEIYGPAL